VVGVVFALPGASFEATLAGASTGLEGTLGVRIVDGATDTEIVARSTADISEYPADSGIYTATLIAPTTQGQYLIVWDTGTVSPSTVAEEDLSVVSSLASVGRGVAFATTDDIAARLEEPELSAESEAAASMLLDLATAVVTQAAGKDSDWADALDPVPDVLRGLTIEVVCRAMARPRGLVSVSETLGQHQRSENYGTSGGSSSLFLTDLEERIVREAVYGTLTGSSTPRALPDRLIDLAEGRDVDEPA
jgi:hypothetical protein